MSARRRGRPPGRKAAAGKPVTAAVRSAPQWNLAPWLLGAVLVGAIVVAYQQAWHAGYIWDDDFYVTQNPLLTAADGLRRIWFSFDAPSQYFPLTYTTFRIEHAIWGFDSSGYHWVNILLHAGNALLLWRLLTVLEIRGAWFAAALFALHPVQVESVAWITERKNVLMGFFFLASLLAWVRFTGEKPVRSRWWWLALGFAFYLLALSAKTTACTLPAALVLILWWRRRPLTAARWLQIAPFVLAGVGAGVISVMWERIHQGGRPDAIPVGAIERVLIASRAIWFYLSKLAWPADLMFSYPRWNVVRSDALAYVWLLALGALGGVIAYARRWLGRGPEVAFGFFVLTLSPLLGVVIVTTFLFSFVADHYQYLACIGPLALFAAGCDAGLARLSWPGRKWLGRAGAVAILATLAILTWRQAEMYKNEETLWLRTIAQNPDSWMSRNNLAGYWAGQGRFDEAIEQYRKVIALRPDDFLGYINLGAALARKGEPAAALREYGRAQALAPNDARIERNLGQALVAQGKIDDAIPHLERAVALREGRPDVNNQKSELQFDLGNAFLQKGDTTTAISHYRGALQLRSNYPAAHSNLGNALMQEGRRKEAIAEYRAALALQPEDPFAHNNLGSALLQEGAIDEARQQFEEAKRLNPGGDRSAEVLFNLGNSYLQKRDLENAIANYRQALSMQPDYPGAHSNLGTALLLQGKTAEAMREFETTLALAPRSAGTLNNLARLLATAPDEGLRDGPRAEQLARQAISINEGRDPASFRALAAALAEEGKFAEAASAVGQAIDLVGESNPGFADVLRRELEAYRNGQKTPGP